MRKKNLILKVFLIVLILIQVLSILVTSFAEEFIPKWYEESKSLYNLGLYKGVSSSLFVPDLNSKLDRQTGVVLLLRLFGEEGKAKNMSEQEAVLSLGKVFKDANKIAPWAIKQMAYAVSTGIIHGYSDGSLKPGDQLTGRAYCAMILNKLKYKFKYEDAGAYFAEAARLEPNDIDQFGANISINKDICVGISFKALRAKFSSSDETIIDTLINAGIVSREQAVKEWLIR